MGCTPDQSWWPLLTRDPRLFSCVHSPLSQVHKVSQPLSAKSINLPDDSRSSRGVWGQENSLMDMANRLGSRWLGGWGFTRWKVLFIAIMTEISIMWYSGIRVEWCKARARAMRWTEEEMHRVLTYHGWHARWWDDQSCHWSGLSEEQTEGLSAYTHHQARIYRDMCMVCETTWQSIGEYCNLRYGLNSDIFQPDTAM